MEVCKQSIKRKRCFWVNIAVTCFSRTNKLWKDNRQPNLQRNSEKIEHSGNYRAYITQDSGENWQCCFFQHYCYHVSNSIKLVCFLYLCLKKVLGFSYPQYHLWAFLLSQIFSGQSEEHNSCFLIDCKLSTDCQQKNSFRNTIRGQETYSCQLFSVKNFWVRCGHKISFAAESNSRCRRKGISDVALTRAEEKKYEQNAQNPLTFIPFVPLAFNDKKTYQRCFEKFWKAQPCQPINKTFSRNFYQLPAIANLKEFHWPQWEVQPLSWFLENFW